MDPTLAGLLGGMIGNVLAPICTQSGELLMSAARHKYDLWKNKNVKNTLNETANILNSKGIDKEADLRQPTGKFASRFIEGAAVEDQEELQRLWATLLANALDPKFKMDSLHPSFIDIIKCLTPIEVKILQYIYDFFAYKKLWCRPAVETYPIFMKEHATATLHIDSHEYEIAYRNLVRVGLITSELPQTSSVRTNGQSVAFSLGTSRFMLTPFGYAFISACIAS